MGKFREFRTLWHEQGIYVVLRKLFRETGAPANLPAPMAIGGLPISCTLPRFSSGDFEKPYVAILSISLVACKNGRKRPSKEEYQLRLESESEVIRILTVHKAKGLEYPVTFIPFLGFSSERRKGTFTYHTTGGELRVDLREFASEDSLAMGRLEERREDARLLYVALTRASSVATFINQP